MNIHFICRGNILRSLVAETYVKSLNLPNTHVISSGTNVNWDDATEKSYFMNTVDLLDHHGIKSFVKDMPEQLTQSRVDGNDITICMNQRVVDEANKLVALPHSVINWNIVDIGEQHRIVEADKKLYLEEIYNEITDKVEELVMAHCLR